MVVKRLFSFWVQARVLIFVCAVIVALSIPFAFAAEQEAVPELKRYRVFSLRHISAEQGKDYLAQADLGTVSQLPGANSLLVTAEPADLIKASAILSLVDAEEQFYIKAIFPASEVENLPSNEQIAAEVGDISIGTFSHPPRGGASSKSIIDIHEGAVIAVTPVNQLERIISAIEQLQAGEKDIKGSETSLEPAEAAKSDEFFDKLLGSLAEAEQVAAELAAQKPSEPNAVARPPEQKVPSESAAELPALKESIIPVVKQLREPNIPTIVEGVETQGVTEGLKAEPSPEISQVVLEIGQPSEVNEIVTRVQPYVPEALPIGEEMLELDLPEKLNIIDLLDLIGKYLHLDYMYDEKVLLGKEVSLRLQGPIKVRDLYPLLESVLKFRGFVMTRKGNLVTIAPMEEALNIDPALHPERGDIKFGDVIITRIFSLKHINTASATNLLTGMKLSVNITPVEETGILIVTGYAYRMARIEEVLRMVDKPGAPRQFRFRQLRYTMAKTLAPKIKTLVEQLGTVSVTIARPELAAEPPSRAPRRGPPPRRPTPAAAEPTGPTVYLDADERTNRILMIGFEDEIDIVEGLVDALDVEQQDLRTLRLYEIQNVGADEVVKKLQELGIIGGGLGPTTRITSAAKPEAAAKPTARGPTQEVLVEEPQVVIIEATNSLLVNATPEQHVQVAMIIGYVDSVTLEEAIPYEIYALENQDPEDLSNVLNQLIKETIKDKEGKIEKVIKREEEIIVIPDTSTFSLIVYASKKNQEWVRKLIKDLDKRRPQVLIDVSLVEITRDDTFAYDLNLIANAKGLVTGNIQISGDFLPNPDSKGNELESGWNQVISVGDSTSHTGFRGFLGEDKIQALLTVMAKKDYGRILAKPRILVNDNEEGIIKTTEKTFVEEETMTYPGTTTGTTPIPVKSIKWVPYEAKIELSITPNISEGDLLRLEISMVREDFQRQDVGPPDYRTSDVKTIVTVPDGSTIILGGLTKLNQTKGGSKVPLLGDVPLVGGLFRTISNNDKTSKLYIFVKANILRPDETAEGLAQLRRISESDRTAFEEAERKFQAKEDWPGIEPEPMEPLRVLDAE
ncbi:MAG: hypothetical protein JSV82_07300 [Planctomycetota bacterium]|nr:MAG: hypothetical protein JSV82_07300 [Planctomycetota bacterium]